MKIAVLIYFQIEKKLVGLVKEDLLNLEWDYEADTYWVERDPPGPSPESIKNQF